MRGMNVSVDIQYEADGGCCEDIKEEEDEEKKLLIKYKQPEP